MRVAAAVARIVAEIGRERVQEILLSSKLYEVLLKELGTMAAVGGVSAVGGVKFLEIPVTNALLFEDARMQLVVQTQSGVLALESRTLIVQDACCECGAQSIGCNTHSAWCPAGGSV